MLARFKPYGSSLTVEGCTECLRLELTLPEVRANILAALGLDQGEAIHMTLESFEPLTERERDVKEAALKVTERWREGIGRSLWLCSPTVEPPEMRRFGERELVVSGCGCGKTHLAFGLARVALDLGCSVKIMTEGDLLNTVRAGYGDGTSQADIVEELGRVGLLVLDDVGSANVKSHDWYESLMFEIINARYLARRPIVVTTNLSPQDLARRLGPRTMSRLDQMGVGVTLDGPDRRRMR